MAAIDKIYVDNRQQYVEFKEWCQKQPPFTDKYGTTVSLMRYVYDHPDDWNGGVVFCGPYYLDAYLIKHCPFDYIQRELQVNYGYWPQEKKNEAYECVKRKDETFFTWLTEDDFKIVDGVVTMPNLEKSDYEEIKDGELYATPYSNKEYEVGKHFRCIYHPLYKYNKPLKGKWFVDVKLPDDLGYMWYHDNHNTWDFCDDFVVCEWSSSTAFCNTIKSLKRQMIKWKLPVGTIVRATGRYVSETYEFIITK